MVIMTDPPAVAVNVDAIQNDGRLINGLGHHAASGEHADVPPFRFASRGPVSRVAEIRRPGRSSPDPGRSLTSEAIPAPDTLPRSSVPSVCQHTDTTFRPPAAASTVQRQLLPFKQFVDRSRLFHRVGNLGIVTWIRTQGMRQIRTYRTIEVRTAIAPIQRSSQLALNVIFRRG